MPSPPKTLHLTTTIYPTPDQIHHLTAMWRTVLTAQHAVTAYLRHRAAGGHQTLLAVAHSPQSWHPSPSQQIAAPTLAQLEAEFRAARDALGWSATVPTSALRWMLAETLREWRVGGAPALPRPWPRTRPPHLQLDHAVQVRDGVTLEIDGMGRNPRVTADLFLPREYWLALLRRQHRRDDAHRAHLAQLEARWLNDGDATAAADLFARRARSTLCGPLPDPGPGAPGTPISRERVMIQHLESDAGLPPRWVAQWFFGVAEVGFPRWCQDDIIGIDLGYRHPFAAVSGQHTALTPRPFRGAFAPPALPDQHARSRRLDLARARALHRRSLFMRLLPIFESQLELALTHRVVVLEAMAWAGFAQRHLAFADYARAVGLTTWVEWLGALAPQHGVQVLNVPPEYTTRTCSQCGHVGKRPRSGRLFRCPHCGHVQAADLNAAAVIRARGQRLLGNQ